MRMECAVGAGPRTDRAQAEAARFGQTRSLAQPGCEICLRTSACVARATSTKGALSCSCRRRPRVSGGKSSTKLSYSCHSGAAVSQSTEVSP